MSRAKWIFVAFWAKNVRKAQESGFWIPGFSYSEDEIALLDQAARSISNDDYGWVLILNAFCFMLLVSVPAIALGLTFKWLMDMNGGPLSTPVYVLGMGIFLIVALAVVFPLSLTLSGSIVARRRPLPADIQPSALGAVYRRVLLQFTRIGAFAFAGMFLAGSLVGWDNHALKVVAPFATAASAIVGIIMLWMLRTKR